MEAYVSCCGLCPEPPCGRYEQGDPTKSPEENIAIAQQLKLLRERAKQ